MLSSLRRASPAILMFLFLPTLGAGGTAFADTSHARIVRLSLVQGDVRFARDVKGDPLSESQIAWESAALNLPIRQGYVVATDNGRAEVEFENGAMAFLAENTVLQFYDLSSEDGGLTTRLILRQGSAEFYVHPGRGDYFSVTGGDFSVQADGKATFRMNNFDDGSSVDVLHGRLTALTKEKNVELDKGQSLTMKAGEADSAEVGRAPEGDEFDQWVSGRIENAAAATNAALQYANSSGYVSGYGDLYTYGSWFPVAGYGMCWRPYGVGFGWSPFDYGSWYFDPFFGWAFLGSYSWGWLPYHYGGWVFQPGTGWIWSPIGTLGSPGVGRWRPVTGVWMRSGGNTGIVPSHPMDAHGKTPLNLAQGMFAVTRRGVTGRITPDSETRWKVENKPARDAIQTQLASASAPARVSRTMPVGAGANGRGSAGESSIVYDRAERRFVNSNAAQPADGRVSQKSAIEAEAPTAAAGGRASEGGAASGAAPPAQKEMRVFPESSRSDNRVPPAANRVNAREGQPRQFVPNNRPAPAPPSVPRAVSSERVFNETAGGGAGRGSGAAPRGSGMGGGGGPAVAPRASAPAPSGGSGGARSTGGGGGGRPH